MEGLLQKTAGWLSEGVGDGGWGRADMRNRSVEGDGYVVHEIVEDEIRREICKWQN